MPRAQDRGGPEFKSQDFKSHAEQLSQTVAAGRPLVIREHAGWDRDCAAIAHPALYLDEAPRHGTVCARVEEITIGSIYLGTEKHCVGRLVRGVRLIYRPDTGYAGIDALRYAAQYPSLRRTVAVNVTVAASGVTGSLPSSLGAHLPARHQAPGPVPHCVDLMF